MGNIVKRRRSPLAEPWLERLIPVVTEVMLAFVVMASTVLVADLGQRSAAGEPQLDKSHYSQSVSAPLA